MLDMKRRIDDINEQMRSKKLYIEKLEEKMDHVKTEINNSKIKLRDTINSSGNVDEKIIPKFENH